MAEKVLNVTLNKSYHLRCSDWEAQTLTEAQVSMTFFPYLSSVQCPLILN